ncbi:MAG: SET domain-containing protein-lysine N-methyltransferase, partial [candidate division Zixibacteria bacterium]|nr:SET domain-containing protein-lysine N-methyltransferase [candidate division Zixibacteria bacterium]
PSREIFLKYSYLSRKGPYYVLCFDDARFFNHSFNPNVAEKANSNGEESLDVAARDIHPGEELTCNYDLFEADFDPSVFAY